MNAPSSMKPRKQSRGFIMSYVLVALALLSLSVAVVARMSGKAADGKRMADIQDEVMSQAGLIRAKLISCMVSYPGGDPTTHDPLPATTSSGTVVSTLNCPGDPNASQALWKSAEGIYAPRSLTGMSNWVFVHNTASAASISITATSGGNATVAALNNAALRFGAQGHFSGSTLTVDITN